MGNVVLGTVFVVIIALVVVSSMTNVVLVGVGVAGAVDSVPSVEYSVNNMDDVGVVPTDPVRTPVDMNWLTVDDGGPYAGGGALSDSSLTTTSSCPFAPTGAWSIVRPRAFPLGNPAAASCHACACVPHIIAYCL